MSNMDRKLAIAGAEGWNPQNEDKLTGTIVAIKKGGEGTKDKPFYPMFLFEREDGTFTNVHAYHDLLQRGLREIGAKVGTRATLAYLGKKAGNRVDTKGDAIEYHRYVVVDLDAAETEDENYDWMNEA